MTLSATPGTVEIVPDRDMEDSEMMQLTPCAFIPFGILLGTAFIGAVISAWIALASGRAPRRPAPARSAEILYFPKPRSLQPRLREGIVTMSKNAR
jgi:hypothetical protein